MKRDVAALNAKTNIPPPQQFTGYFRNAHLNPYGLR